MSSWISDYRQTQNYSGTGVVHIYAHVECDDIADLPTTTQFSGFVLDKESIAHVINGNQKYMLNSQGVWMLQEDPLFSGIYTKSEIDDMFSDVDDIQTAQAVSIRDLQFDVEALQQADSVTNGRLAKLVDEGAKNIANLTGNTRTENGVTMTIEPDRSVTLSGTSSHYYSFRIIGDQSGTDYQYGVPIPRGTYVLTGVDINASATTSRYILGIRTASDVARTSTSIYTSPYEFTVTNDTTRIDLSVYMTTGASFNNPIAHFYPMITESWKYALSQAFVPYSLTNAELTKLILS